MKKIFSLFAAVLFAGSMMADPIVINASDVTTIASGATSGLDVTLQGINIVWQGAYYNSDGGDGGSASVDFRVYANKSMTLTAESNISKVEIAGYCKAGLTVTANAGTITTGASYASETTKGTLEDPLIVVDEIGATSVTLTCTKQVRAYTLRITLDGDVPPTPSVATPVISGEAEFTDSVIVTITCSTPEADIYYTTDGTTDPKCDCAAAPEYTHEIVLKETTTIMAAAYTGNDWSAVASKTFTKKELQVAISCADVYSKAKGDELALNDVVVTYANGKYVYVQDTTGSMLLYLADNTTWKAGDVLSGVEGTLDIYYGLYEVKLTNVQTTAVQATAGEAPAPVEYTKAPKAADMNKYIVLKGVTMDTTAFVNKNINATIGDETFVIRNQFGSNMVFDTTAVYDITGVVALYNTTVQVYLTSAVLVSNPEMDAMVFNWSVLSGAQIGTINYGASTEASTVKVHTNTFTLNAIKFNSSYVYADGKYITIKPKEGSFKAGDELSVMVWFSNADDSTKYAMVDVYAADGTTRLFRSDSAKTVNGRLHEEDAEVQTFTLAADQDSLLLGRYGNTAMFINYLRVIREDPEPVFPDTLSCAQAREAALNGMTDSVKVRGYVTEIAYAWKDGSMSFWMADTLNGGKVFEAYKCAIEKQEDAVSVGDLVVATGKLTKYNTTPELEAGCTVEIIEKTQILPKNLGEKTIAEFLNLKNTLDTCILTGVVDSIVNTTYGNLYLSDTTAQLYIYGVLTPAGEAKKFAELGVAAGDTLTVLAIYTEYQGAPQAKNAIFVEVKKAPVADTVEVSLSEGLRYDDYVAEEGWWQIYGEDDKFVVSVSNISTTQAEGTYTIEDLDADYTYLGVIEGKDTTFVAFVSGSVTLSTNAEAGSVTVEGTLIGNDNKAYHLNLLYVAPQAKDTVVLNIPEAALIDYYAASGLYGVYGTNVEKDHQVYIALWAEDGFQGDFTEADLDMKYIGSGVIDKDGIQEIYTASITVTPGNGGDYNITADLLCYNNTLYKVTMYVPAGQAIDEVDAAQKAVKMIKGGQLIIEKAGKSYNVLGTRL